MSAPIGNQYAKAKLKYKTLKKLKDAIDEYFNYCDNRISHFYSAKAEGIVDVLDPAPYTMSGLARSMGIDRDTLINYSHRKMYFGAIKEARDKVHEDVETRLMEKSAVGAIFNLKNNFGWKDRTEIDKTITDNSKKVSDEELDERINSRIKKYAPKRKGSSIGRSNGKRSPQSK